MSSTDLNRYRQRTAELIAKRVAPSDVVRTLFKEFGEISAIFLIQFFADAYKIRPGDISYIFAEWWPDGIGSIPDEEFNTLLQKEVKRVRANKHEP